MIIISVILATLRKNDHINSLPTSSVDQTLKIAVTPEKIHTLFLLCLCEVGRAHETRYAEPMLV